MPEHVHEWSIDHQIIDVDGPLPVGEVFAYCGCGEELRSDDIFRRVNATERLSAEHAMTFSFTIRQMARLLGEITERASGDRRLLDFDVDEDQLQNYAAALEGDEKPS